MYSALVDHQWQWALSHGCCASRAAVWVFAVMLLDNVVIELNRVYVKVMYIRACISSCSAVLIYEVVCVCAYVCSCCVTEWGRTQWRCTMYRLPDRIVAVIRCQARKRILFRESRMSDQPDPAQAVDTNSQPSPRKFRPLELLVSPWCISRG